MPAVLVHGVPEIPEVWDPLREHLSRSDVVALRLPGFGCPRPEGFGATKEEYVTWLVGELERLRGDGPIDLVGHDWGGAFVVRVVSTRPDLVRSWVSDAVGVGHEGFEWHDLAKVWQTPEAGEEFFDQQLTVSADDRAAFMETMGVPRDRATAVTSVDRTMADCILALYRSATGIGAEWGPGFHDIPAPGLAILPENDPFRGIESTRAGAARAGARITELPGVGHWWMLQDPASGASVLEKFWASLDGKGTG